MGFFIALHSCCDCVVILGQCHEIIIMTLCSCDKWECWLLECKYAMSYFIWVGWRLAGEEFQCGICHQLISGGGDC